LDFPEVDRLSIQPKHFEQIPDNRKLQPYQEALSIAQLLLLNYRPDLMAGRNHLLALLFDMNSLWEEYIYRVLKKSLGREWQVLAQRSQYFWENQRIKPDIILRNQHNTYVIDTKWKALEHGRPSDADLKQMYVYNHHWESLQSMLLYPAAHVVQDMEGMYRLPLDGAEHYCKLGFVEVVDGEGLRRDVGAQVMGKVI
jgi:5-methylcytosine-specific restriction enzyme subunit McrC